MALAMSRAMGVQIFVAGLHWQKSGLYSLTARLPDAAGEFMKDYDSILPVSPFEFEVELWDA